MGQKFLGRLTESRSDWRGALRSLVRERSLGEDLGWGVGWGAAMSIGFSLIVLLFAALRGSTSYPEYDRTTWDFIAIYWLVGLPAGAVVGLLRPLSQFHLGAGVIGWAAGLCVYGGVGLVMDGLRLRVLVIGAILGLAGAWIGIREWEKAHLPE